MLTQIQAEYIILSLIAVIAVILVVLIILLVKLSKINTQHKILTRGMNEQNIEDILLKYIEKTDQLTKSLSVAESDIAGMQKLIARKAANISILRYNAYEEQGNDLSFTVAILNDQLDGFVITSLYNRHDQRVYAKPITNGESTYPLSDEEIQAIQDIVKNRR